MSGIGGRNPGIETQVADWLAQQGLEIYLVGGSVRDRLLKRQVHDLDVAVAGDGLALARRLADHFHGAYYPLDERRSTGRAILRGDGGRRFTVDIAAFRGVDLAADLRDRDFTINALAVDVLAPERVIDHHGGVADLAARVIRPVSDDTIRNDPLRALRAVRQSGELRFALATQTKNLIRRDGAGLGEIAGERIRDELARLLSLHCTSSCIEQLDDLALIAPIIPELESLRNLAQPPPHRWDALTHSFKTVSALEEILARLPVNDGAQNQDAVGEKGGESLPIANGCAGESPAGLDGLAPFAEQIGTHVGQSLGADRTRLVTLKLAALLHDTGKPGARSVDAGGRIRFIDHQREGVRITGDVLRRLRFNRAEVHLGRRIVRHHMRPLLLASQESVSRRAIYRFFRDTGDAGVDVLLHALADQIAHCPPDAEGGRWPNLVTLAVRMLSDYWQRSSARVTPAPLIDGHDVQRECGLQPGPQIGRLLEAVREAQVSGDVRTREDALALVRARATQRDSRPRANSGT
jgi:tRNA nucleotidyltransferase/poly(A) polymerase